MSHSTSLDERRFTEVFETCHAAVLAYVRRRIVASVAQDVVAETFLAAWRRLDDVPLTPLPWLYRAASFEISHARRKLALDSQFGNLGMDGGPSALDPADEITDADQWSTAFRELSEGDKEILRLVAWENVAPTEGAFIFECSVAAFKVRLHRARRRLTRLLEASEVDDAIPLVAFDRLESDSPALIIHAARADLLAGDAHQTIQKECL